MTNGKSTIFSDRPFTEKVADVFQFQYQNNKVYRRFCDALDISPQQVTKQQGDCIDPLPLLPVKAFKDANVTTEVGKDAELVFKSSGTSDMRRSVHRIPDPQIYDQALLEGFRKFYDLGDAVIWGYTPGYDENPDSSLIYMLQKLIDQDKDGMSRFLPLDEDLDEATIEEVHESGKQLIIFGAAFGLVDIVEQKSVSLPSNSIIIETGGMKTHRREISRYEMHDKFANGFGLDISRIHSEYGMCELLSQAYATGGKWFRTVPWMQVTIRDPEDPSKVVSPFTEGLIGIIDLANVYSCSFLLTGDKGMMDNEGRFQVMGRWNSKDLRGCNFLIDRD